MSLQDFKNITFISIRYSVTASTVRFHRAVRGSIPRIGDFFFLFHCETYCNLFMISLAGFTVLTRVKDA